MRTRGITLLTVAAALLFAEGLLAGPAPQEAASSLKERNEQFIKSENDSRRALLAAIYEQLGERDWFGSYKVYAMRRHLIVCSPHLTRSLARHITSKIDPELKRALWNAGVDGIDFVAAYYPNMAFVPAKNDALHWHVGSYVLSPPPAPRPKGEPGHLMRD